MAIIIQIGSATSVDHNDYDLTLDQAAKELFEGRNVIAREFEDYDDDYSFPAVDTLHASNYEGETIEQIVGDLRCFYESFGRTTH
jgi:hypothetical protein